MLFSATLLGKNLSRFHVKSTCLAALPVPWPLQYTKKCLYYSEVLRLPENPQRRFQWFSVTFLLISDPSLLCMAAGIFESSASDDGLADAWWSSQWICWMGRRGQCRELLWEVALERAEAKDWRVRHVASVVETSSSSSDQMQFCLL